jgi:AcrR family transcriptional regulator
VGLRELKMERTRQLVAETALELFSEHGFDHTTVEQIAAAAEIGTRTLYRYFPTKEALIVEFMRTHLSAALDALRAQPEETPLPQALYAVVDSVVATTAANARRVMTAYELAGHNPSVRGQISELWWEWRCEVASVISHRKRDKSSDMNVEMTAILCMVAIETSVRVWVEGGGRASMRRLVNRALGMLRSGEIPIATPPA